MCEAPGVIPSTENVDGGQGEASFAFCYHYAQEILNDIHVCGKILLPARANQPNNLILPFSTSLLIFAKALKRVCSFYSQRYFSQPHTYTQQQKQTDMNTVKALISNRLLSLMGKPSEAFQKRAQLSFPKHFPPALV
jgi:hypothetical protein